MCFARFVRRRSVTIAFSSRYTLSDRKRYSVTCIHDVLFFAFFILTRFFLFFIFVVVLPDFTSQVRGERFDEGTLH